MQKLAYSVAVALILMLSCPIVQADPVYYGVAEFGGHWYQAVYAPGGITWNDAQASAEACGGYLASIGGYSENVFAVGLVNYDEFWPTLDSVGNVVDLPGRYGGYGPWLGGFQPAGSPEPGGGWQWVTGEPMVGYTSWTPGAPANVGNENSLQFYAVGGAPNPVSPTWNDLEDWTLLRGFIIEYDTNPVDEAPPVITAEVDQTTIWPPNHKTVTVNVSGTIDDDSDISDACVLVEDEYGELDGATDITPAADGSYTVPVDLIAWRDGGDKDGRIYTLTVWAMDIHGNLGSSESVVVLVPHDQRRKGGKK